MVLTQSISEIQEILNQIPDPELPVISIVELGMVRKLYYTAENCLVVEITPTYSGCPAVDPVIKMIKEKLSEKGLKNVKIKQVLSPAWTTEWMSESTKQKLKDFGIAPPKRLTDKQGEFEGIKCPRCSFENVSLISAFGSTACKALLKCNDCLESFEYFKCF